LRYCKEISPATVFILVTGVPTIDTAIDAVNFGADRYVIKGDRLLDELRPAVQSVAERLELKKEAGYLRRELRRLTGLDRMIGTSPKMREIFELIQNIAPQSSRVLITGESGTGKELVARAIHENSARVKHPFVTINCGAFPETLLESELFGYMKGAFTGANENRRGLFQAAHGGTLFMDEIGNMSVTMQVKLYRVLQEGKVRPIGSTEESDVDVRVIAATNKDLEKEIAEERFREDLYYRLSVIPIHLPPLRERRDDIPLLARHFMQEFAREYGRRGKGIDPSAIAALQQYSWPGNVRELRNVIERLIIMVAGSAITSRDLAFLDSAAQISLPDDSPATPALRLSEARGRFERDYILRTLAAQDGNISRTAEILGVERSNLYRKMRALGIVPARAGVGEGDTGGDEV
jgi:DNA-binding NtrC family response regulator